MANVRLWPWIIYFSMLLLYSIIVFPSPLCKAELIGNFCVNRRCAPNCSVNFTFFEFLYFVYFAVTGTTGKPKRPESRNDRKARNDQKAITTGKARTSEMIPVPIFIGVPYQCPLRQYAIQTEQ